MVPFTAQTKHTGKVVFILSYIYDMLSVFNGHKTHNSPFIIIIYHLSTIYLGPVYQEMIRHMSFNAIRTVTCEIM